MSLDISLKAVRETEVYNTNITHNLGPMASEAGIYEHLWRPEEIQVSKASQLIEPLRDAIRLMEEDPERFKKHNPSNGWGSYQGLLAFIEDYLKACEQSPDADIDVCR